MNPPVLDGYDLVALIALVVVMGVLGWSLSRSGKYGVSVVIAKSLAVLTIWTTFGLAVTDNKTLGDVALVSVGALAGALTQRAPKTRAEDWPEQPQSQTPDPSALPDPAPANSAAAGPVQDTSAGQSADDADTPGSGARFRNQQNLDLD